MFYHVPRMLSCAIPTLSLTCCRTRKQLEESAAGDIEADQARVRELAAKLRCVTGSLLVAATATGLFAAGLSTHPSLLELSSQAFSQKLPRAALSPLLVCVAAVVKSRQEQARAGGHNSTCLLVIDHLRQEESCLTQPCIQSCCCRTFAEVEWDAHL